MARILIFALLVGITVYAILDWCFHAKEGTPGKLSRWLWLAVIVLIPVAGPLTWVILRLLMKADEIDAAAGRNTVAPDDDPEYLSHIADKIDRRQEKKHDR